ncbi:MAG: hypothetical protein IKI42_02240 [Clostridia bacterium]|nr:hypothetical protein [Clostridia bacterium]
MKKLITSLLSGILALALLCGCSALKKQNKKEEADDLAIDPAKEEIIAVMNGSMELDELSLEELLTYYDKFLAGENDVLSDGLLYDLLYKNETVQQDDLAAELDFTYPENAQTAEYTEDPWKTDKDFEALDVTAGMTPEEKAEFESMLDELNSADFNSMKIQYEDILHGIEGFEDIDIGAVIPDDPDMPEISDKWPDNALAKAVPDPAFPGMTVTVTEDAIYAVSSETDAAAVKAYVSKLKAAGFTEDVNESEQTVAGYTIYSFGASNKSGINVALQHIQGTTSLSVTRG